jgi:MFS family permease
LLSATVSGFWGWVSSLFIRIHGLPVQEAGFYIAAFAGVGGLIGNLSAAVVAGRVGQRGSRAVLTFIAMGAAAIFPFGAIMALAPKFAVAVVMLPVVAALANCLFGPLVGVMLTLAKVRMRGVASSFLYVCGTLVGMGVGPLIVGTISQALGGGNAIRYGLAALFLLNTWAAFHFLSGRRTLEADINRAS